MITRSKIKQLNSLEQKKYREKYSQFLIEGIRLIEEAVSSKAPILQVWYAADIQTSGRGNDLIETCLNRSIPCEEAAPEELGSISETVHGQGIFALIQIPGEQKIKRGEQENWLYLDQIRDPGNLGTLLRTADWFGIRYVALSKGCVDVYNPKVIRSGMGAHFHLCIYPDTGLHRIKEFNHIILAADRKGKPAFTNYASQFTKWCLVLGSEAHGISKKLKPHIDHFIAVPGKGSAESLNVAVAGGILLYCLHP